MKLLAPKGVYVEEVMKGGAADKAGIKKGDVIVAVDSTTITTPSSVQEKSAHIIRETRLPSELSVTEMRRHWR